MISTSRFAGAASLTRTAITAAGSLLCATASAQDSVLPSAPIQVPAAGLFAALALLAIFLIGLFFWRRGLLRGFAAERADLIERLQDRERSEQTQVRMRDELESEIAKLRVERNKAVKEFAEARQALDSAVARYEDLARIDGLTGLANRARFDEALDDEIKRMVRERKPLSMLVCEIDAIDRYRQDTDSTRADAAQKRIASSVEGTFRRAGDLVARLENDHIVVILPATDADAANRFGERLMKGIWDLCIPFGGSEIADRLTVSVGVATAAPDQLHKPDDLIKAAERSLYSATENGRNRVGPASAVSR